ELALEPERRTPATSRQVDEWVARIPVLILPPRALEHRTRLRPDGEQSLARVLYRAESLELRRERRVDVQQRLGLAFDAHPDAVVGMCRRNDRKHEADPGHHGTDWTIYLPQLLPNTLSRSEVVADADAA